MALIEIADSGIADAVNDVYFELALADDRDPLNGLDAVLRNAPGISSNDGVDKIDPPISLPNYYSSLTVSPWEVSVTWNEENVVTAISTVGRIHPPSTKGPEQCQRWLYNLSLSDEAARYTVTKKALNGQEYVFTTQKPELVARMAEILVGRVADKISAWGSRFTND